MDNLFKTALEESEFGENNEIIYNFMKLLLLICIVKYNFHSLFYQTFISEKAVNVQCIVVYPKDKYWNMLFMQLRE